MIRYLEYLYLCGTIAIGIFMALNFKEMPLGNKIVLSLGAMLCAFMYSFRRKQRQMMEDIDRRESDAQPEEEESNQHQDKDGH